MSRIRLSIALIGLIVAASGGSMGCAPYDYDGPVYDDGHGAYGWLERRNSVLDGSTPGEIVNQEGTEEQPVMEEETPVVRAPRSSSPLTPVPDPTMNTPTTGRRPNTRVMR